MSRRGIEERERDDQWAIGLARAVEAKLWPDPAGVAVAFVSFVRGVLRVGERTGEGTNAGGVVCSEGINRAFSTYTLGRRKVMDLSMSLDFYNK